MSFPLALVAHLQRMSLSLSERMVTCSKACEALGRRLERKGTRDLPYHEQHAAQGECKRKLVWPHRKDGRR